MTEAGWQQAADEMTNQVAFLLQGVVMAMGSEASFNILQMLNSLRCMVLSLGTNFWQFFASLYYFALYFRFEKEILKYVDEYYPYLCTCQKESDVFVKLMKATAASMTVMSGCSPAAQKAKANKNSSI
tara:strand:+ start:250 stop:633 length:384 start_codon:yes stop_codon:yes gene_type:complete